MSIFAAVMDTADKRGKLQVTRVDCATSCYELSMMPGQEVLHPGTITIGLPEGEAAVTERTRARLSSGWDYEQHSP